MPENATMFQMTLFNEVVFAAQNKPTKKVETRPTKATKANQDHHITQGTKFTGSHIFPQI